MFRSRHLPQPEARRVLADSALEFETSGQGRDWRDAQAPIWLPRGREAK